MNEKNLAELGITYDETYPFPVLDIQNPLAVAKISLYGGQLISYVPVNAKPVIWQSPESICEIGKPLIGGIPVCWPWFGISKEQGKPPHGFVRTAMWQFVDASRLADNSTRIVLAIDEGFCDSMYCDIKFRLELHFTIGNTLEVTLLICNTDSTEYSYEGSIHSYFAISDVEQVYLDGLNNVPYIDRALGLSAYNIQHESLRIDRELNRIFLPSTEPVEIVDHRWKRTIKVEKSGSLSTVIWNPWTEKATAMQGIGNGYRQMVCVETSQIRKDSRIIKPGQINMLSQKISLLN